MHFKLSKEKLQFLSVSEFKSSCNNFVVENFSRIKNDVIVSSMCVHFCFEHKNVKLKKKHNMITSIWVSLLKQSKMKRIVLFHLS